MTPQETQPLQDFLNQLIQVRGIPKDPQADALINSAVAQQPDAAYLLVQRALLMEQALNTAKAQIATLQRQIQMQAAQPAPVSSFLDQNAWGNTPAPSVAQRPAASMPMMQAPAPMQAPPMQNQAPAAAPGFFGGGIGNVLGTVATTAAGVAGGAFLFQGIEHLMHPNSGGAGFMNQGGMNPLAAPVENTTINNYYNDDSSTDDDQSDNDVASNDNSDDDSVI